MPLAVTVLPIPILQGEPRLALLVLLVPILQLEARLALLVLLLVNTGIP